MTGAYLGTLVNQSPTIVFTAGEKMEGAQCKAVTLGAGGVIKVVDTAGAEPVGLIAPQTEETIEDGDRVNVQVQYAGGWITGEDVSAGDKLTADATGAAVKAKTGNFVFAVALADATKGSVASVLITREGASA